MEDFNPDGFKKLSERDKISIALSYINLLVNDVRNLKKSFFSEQNLNLFIGLEDESKYQNKDKSFQELLKESRDMLKEAWHKKDSYLVDAECCLVFDGKSAEEMFNIEWFKSRRNECLIETIKLGGKKSKQLLNFLEFSLIGGKSLSEVLIVLPPENVKRDENWSFLWNLMVNDSFNKVFATEKMIATFTSESVDKSLKFSLADSLVNNFKELARETLVDYRAVDVLEYKKEDSSSKKIKLLMAEFLFENCRLLSELKKLSPEHFNEITGVVFKSAQELRNNEKITTLPTGLFLESCRKSFFSDDGINSEMVMNLDSLFDFKKTLDLSVSEDSIIRDIKDARSVLGLPLAPFNASIFSEALRLTGTEDKASGEMKDQTLMSCMSMVNFIVEKGDAFKKFSPGRVAYFYMAVDKIKEQPLNKLLEINSRMIKEGISDGELNPVIMEKMLEFELNSTLGVSEVKQNLEPVRSLKL